MAAIISSVGAQTEEDLAYKCALCRNEISVQRSEMAEYEATAKICPECNAGMMKNDLAYTYPPWRRS
jgi:hypothetical protein